MKEFIKKFAKWCGKYPRTANALVDISNSIMDVALKILTWREKNPKASKALFYLLFPITIFFTLFHRWVFMKVFFILLKESVKKGDEHKVLRSNVAFLKSMARKNMWKYKISKKWFNKTMRKYEVKMYNFSFPDKSKMSFNHYRTLIDIYMQYPVIGGGSLNPEGTTIKVE